MKVTKKTKRILFVLSMGLVIVISFKVSIKAIESKINGILVTQGIDEIKRLESRDVASIEATIDEMRREEAYVEGDFKSLFSKSVIMGDSITEGLVAYGVLDKASVVARKGRNVMSAKGDIETTVNLYPSNVFMAYGMNDVLSYGTNIQGFINEYEKRIDEIKAKLPKVKIYICGILPVQQVAINKHKVYTRIGEYNDAIEEMCNSLEVGFIETKSILDGKNNLYEADGIHFKMDFYPVWLESLARAAKL